MSLLCEWRRLCGLHAPDKRRENEITYIFFRFFFFINAAQRIKVMRRSCVKAWSVLASAAERLSRRLISDVVAQLGGLQSAPGTSAHQGNLPLCSDAMIAN